MKKMIVSTQLTGTHTARSMFSGGWAAISYELTEDPFFKQVFYGYGDTEQEALNSMHKQIEEQHATGQ